MAGRSLNKVLLIGNLTRDPEIRYTSKNQAIAKMGIATNRTWISQDSGEREEQVEYTNLTAWGKLAENCGKYLHKGDKAYFEGRLQTSEYTAKDGTQRKSTEVVVDNMILLGGRGGAAMADMDDAGSAPQPAAKAPKSKKKAAAEPEDAPSDDVSAVEDISDDIPF